MMKNTFAVDTICTTRYDMHSKMTGCQPHTAYKILTTNKLKTNSTSIRNQKN